jgi:hypothetical protein
VPKKKIDPEPITVPLSEEGCKLTRGGARGLGPYPNRVTFCPFMEWNTGKVSSSYTARCMAFGVRLKRRAADVSYVGDVFRCGACKKLIGARLRIAVEGR